MGQKIFSGICAIAVIVVLLVIPIPARAQQAGTEDDNLLSYAGSFFLSLLHFPYKLTTCAGTLGLTSIAYVGTYGVPGNYRGGTNGKEIGEVARGSCSGPWVITPDQVKKDYE